MRIRDKQRIFKRFMAKETIHSMGKEIYFKQDPYRPGWTPWRLTMCIGQVEQAIRDCIKEMKK